MASPSLKVSALLSRASPVLTNGAAAVFFMLDAAPVWFAIAIYLVWWPSRLVDLRRQPVDKEYALGGEVIEYGTSLQKPPFNFH